MRKLLIAALLILTLPAYSQSGVAVSIRSGSSDPGLCRPGSLNVFINRNANPSVFKICASNNTWASLASLAGGTFTGPILLPNGTAAAPSLGLASDADGTGTGLFRSAANTLGFSTDGTERWVINASGSLNPLVANTYSIGNASVPVKDITLSAGAGSETYIPIGVVTVSTTSAATAADVVETDLWTFDLPANTLNSDGDTVRITVFGSAAANANTKTVKVYFGAGNATVFTDTSSATGWSGTFTVIRTGAATQVYALVGTHGSGISSNVNGTFARDTTAIITLKVTGQNGVASASDITFKGAIVELLP